MKYILKRILLFVVIVCIPCFVLSGCVIYFHEPIEPYLVDRTEGWEPKLMLVVGLTPTDATEKLDADASVFWSNYIDLESFNPKDYDHYSKFEPEVNAALLSADELREIQITADCMEIPAYAEPDLSSVVLPLTAQGAFDISVGMNVKKWYGTTPLAMTQGPFCVYYSEVSNALFVVTNTYIQAFDKETGELLMMHRYGKGSWNRDVWGKDQSIEIEE